MYIGQTEALSMSMALPVHGYVPGQTIPIRIVMINPSTVMVKKLRIVFKKVTLFSFNRSVVKCVSFLFHFACCKYLGFEAGFRELISRFSEIASIPKFRLIPRTDFVSDRERIFGGHS